MTETFAERASYYVDVLRWPVFPVSRNKVPCIKGGCHAASLDPTLIARWAREFPHANVAVATGKPSGVVVIDIDGPVGEESWKKLIRRVWWREPVCPQVITAKGRHLYFSGSGVGNRVSSVLGKGIDVRGDGGSAILPPSIHETGVVYEWLDYPHQVCPPLLPPALVRILNDEEPWPLLVRPRTQRRNPAAERAPPDIKRLADTVRTAPEGTRNYTLNTAAFLAAKAVRAGKVSRDTVLHALTEAALQAGLQRHEIRATILSGLRGGAKKL